VRSIDSAAGDLPLIALDLRKTAERENRREGREPSKAVNEVDALPELPELRAHLPELPNPPRGTAVRRNSITDELRGCSTVRMSEECDLVPPFDEPSSEEVDHPFDPAVVDGWDGNIRVDGQRDSQVNSRR
jgi:hypothetical protein